MNSIRPEVWVCHVHHLYYLGIFSLQGPEDQSKLDYAKWDFFCPSLELASDKPGFNESSQFDLSATLGSILVSSLCWLYFHTPHDAKVAATTLIAKMLSGSSQHLSLDQSKILKVNSTWLGLSNVPIPEPVIVAQEAWCFLIS